MINGLQPLEYQFAKTFSLVNNTVEQTVVTITPASASQPFEVQVKLDATNLTQSNTLRLKERIDGVNDRTINPIVSWVVGMSPGVMLGPIKSGRLITITAQAAVAEGAARDIPITVMLKAGNLPAVV